jgi:hypothetical protein
MTRPTAPLIERHAALWSSDAWYRRSWVLWPQAVSLLVAGMIWAGASTMTAPPPANWGHPGDTPNTAAPAAQDKGSSETIMGKTFSKIVPAGGYNIPLPEGNWTGLAADTITAVNGQKVHGVQYFLGRIEAGRLVGAVQIFATETTERPGAGFKKFTDCDNKSGNNIFTENEGCVEYDSQSYWRIHNYYSAFQSWDDRTLNMQNLERSAGRALVEQNVKFPQDFVSLEFNRSEKWGWLRVMYLFSPEAEGISSKPVSNYRDSDWHSANIVRFPEKMAYANKLKLWGKSLWPQFKAAFAAAE